MLKYHALPGASESTQLGASKVTVQGEMLSFSGGMINGAANIISADNNFAKLGGFVHKIDSVLVPSSVPVKTIVDIATATSSLGTFVTILGAAKLVDTFDLPRNNAWTVFAPTDAAFAKIQSTVYCEGYGGRRCSTVEEALKDEKLLRTILEAHVVSSAVFSKDLPVNITTLGGERINTSTLKINVKDISAINGVLHMLDEVIIPHSLPATWKAPTKTKDIPIIPLMSFLLCLLAFICSIAPALRGGGRARAARRVVTFFSQFAGA